MDKVSFFDSISVWTPDFTLIRQALYCLRHTSSPFTSGYFSDSSGDQGPQYSCFILTLIGGKLFLLVWSVTVMFQLSALWVARVTGVSHWHLAPSFYFWFYLCNDKFCVSKFGIHIAIIRNNSYLCIWFFPSLFLTFNFFCELKLSFWNKAGYK
jgi:hypothetical protein